MIQNYCTLKKHCLTPYSINGIKYNIGDLNDRQLEISEKILMKKNELADNEKRQLEAIRYIRSYRDKKASEQMRDNLKQHMDQRLATKISGNSRMMKAVDEITKFVEKSYNNN